MATYATEAEVVSQIGWVDADGNRPTLSTNTIPTLAEVTALIEEAEEAIENHCRTAWQEKTVTDEIHSFPKYIPNRFFHSILLQLNNRHIKTFSTGSGDKIEVWQSGSWYDLVANGTEGVAPGDQDYYVDYVNGLLYINTNYYIYYQENSVKVTYRYGQATIPKNIARATRLLAAALLMESGFDWVYSLREGGEPGAMSNAEKAMKWEERAYKLASKFKEVTPIPQY